MLIKKYINKFNISTKEDICIFFIYIYEYSLANLYNVNELNRMMTKFKDKLKNIDNLELFWYGLYLYFEKEIIEESNLLYLSDCINKYIFELNILSIKDIKQAIFEIDTILDKKNFQFLKSKIEYDEEDLFFNILKPNINTLKKIILNNKKLISSEKIKEFSILKIDTLNKYRNEIDLCIGLYLVQMIQSLKELFPILKKQIVKETFGIKDYSNWLIDNNIVDDIFVQFCMDIIDESKLNNNLRTDIRNIFVNSYISFYFYLK